MPSFNQITVVTSGGSFDISPYGRAFSESSELLTREDRAASGKLRRDIIAEKKTFSLVYDTIDSRTLEMLEMLFDQYQDEEMQLIVYRKNAAGSISHRQYTVLMRPFSRKRGSKGLWNAVTAEFVEV